MLVDLIRVEHTEECERGIILINNEIVCCTLELPDRANARSVSCIPTGIYPLEHFKSPHHGDVFLVKDVPERDMIEIHTGNTTDDLRGCIAPGEKFGTYKGKKAVLYSRVALGKLKKLTKEQTLILRVRNA
jgi:hypothetical protein